jgi:UDP-N-acetylglucosamine enolpyruvyl transferase
MDQFRIEGGVPLRLSAGASGSKNSVLALMARRALDEPVVLANAARQGPRHDAQILGGLGIAGGWGRQTRAHIDGGEASGRPTIWSLRKSFVVLGPARALRSRPRRWSCAIGADVDPAPEGHGGARCRSARGQLRRGARDAARRALDLDLRTVNGAERADGRGLARHDRDQAPRASQRSGLVAVLRAMGAQIEQAEPTT